MANEWIDELMDDANQRMQGAVNVLEEDLNGFRTGRASPQLIEKLPVEMYGVSMELRQMASISVPEPQQLAIRPYDANSMSAIERAILKSDLSLTPNNDGKFIRLNIPRLTQERRIKLKKVIGKRVEEGRVAVRNVRRDILRDLKDLKDEGAVSEDEQNRAKDNVEDVTKKYIDLITAASKRKEAEIMEV